LPDASTRKTDASPSIEGVSATELRKRFFGALGDKS